jgi:penicillin-binding protein 1A
LANLSVGQYALLAGITQAPSIYDPTVNPDAAANRRAQVLAAMLSEHVITGAQADAAGREPVLAPNGPGC